MKRTIQVGSIPEEFSIQLKKIVQNNFVTFRVLPVKHLTKLNRESSEDYKIYIFVFEVGSTEWWQISFSLTNV